jgi:hypothetical protein
MLEAALKGHGRRWRRCAGGYVEIPTGIEVGSLKLIVDRLRLA